MPIRSIAACWGLILLALAGVLGSTAYAQTPGGGRPPQFTPYPNLEGGKSIMDVKTYQDWTLRYALRSVPGVSEVNAWGGQSKQYAIELGSALL